MAITFKSIWRILRPILTLGLSLLATGIAKKNDPQSTQVAETVQTVGDVVLDSIDNEVSQDTTSKK